MLSDIEIAQGCQMRPITEVAAAAGLDADDLELYGKYKAKLSADVWTKVKDKENGKLVLVTAINPTPAGEGKTTTSVGLGQALCKQGKNAIIALREPSLGPVFGIKGGAAGGGYAQVVPMEDINLHFTGDMHAITAANNLLCAMLDNHMQQGNLLNIDPRRIVFTRVMDMNDRALRNITIGLGGKVNGVPREDHFMITVASEVMAILCLAADLDDLKKRFGDILVAYSYTGKPIYARDLHAEGAMTALMKDAIKPNLVQTLEGTPCLMHGGPFANIAHGCNSVQATKLALKLGDIAITEAGFGADLGAEKFMDIKCRKAGLAPDCIVLVATVRALKYNGGVAKADLNQPNMDALKHGICNLDAHLDNMKKFGVPVVVAVNAFPTDTDEEMDFIREHCAERGVRVALSEVFAKGDRKVPALIFGVLNAAALALFFYGGNAMWVNVLSMVLFGIAIGVLICFLGGLMAVDIVPRKATGAALGVVGMTSYIAAGIQDVASGWLIDSNITVAADGVKHYDFGPVAIFWLAAAVISFLLPLLNRGKVKEF